MEIAERRIPTLRPLADLVRGLFSFQGRARRTHLFGLMMVAGPVAGMPLAALALLGAGEPALSVARAIATGLVLYIWIATLVRRLHDQGRSGWWSLPLYIAAGLIMLGAALQPQQQYGSPSFDFLLWHFHPVPSPLTAVLTVAFLGWLWMIIAVSLAPPQQGTNRYGPDPRV